MWGRGGSPDKVFKAFGVQAWGQEGEYLCVCERVSVCVCVSSLEPTIPCVCMHVFVKKKKMEKNLNNKCFICFNVPVKVSGGLGTRHIAIPHNVWIWAKRCQGWARLSPSSPCPPVATAVNTPSLPPPALLE
jgi:hypothetical protein